MDQTKTLTSGQLARRFGLGPSAIRFYERRGVLPEPDRSSGETGERRYGPDDVRRMEVLDIAKSVGFSLDEIRVLLQPAQAGTPAHRALRDLAERKLPEVDALIERAQTMRAWLMTARDCSCNTLDVCDLANEPSETDTSLDAPPPLRVAHVCSTAASM